MRTLVIFLEEPSAKAMLEGLLPRLLPAGIVVRYIVFEGKQDLEKQLEKRLRGWQLPQSLFLILRDQDSGDCRKIKAGLVQTCVAAGRPEAQVRIACRELESWYLGDLHAVGRALGLHGLARQSATAKFRQPDKLENPSLELTKLTRGQYQKVAGSRLLGPLLRLNDNASHSFQVFILGLRRLTASSTF